MFKWTTTRGEVPVHEQRYKSAYPCCRHKVTAGKTSKGLRHKAGNPALPPTVYTVQTGNKVIRHR